MITTDPLLKMLPTVVKRFKNSKNLLRNPLNLMIICLMLFICCSNIDKNKQQGSKTPITNSQSKGINPFDEIDENSSDFLVKKKNLKIKDFKILNLKPEIATKILSESKDKISMIIPYLKEDIQLNLSKEKIFSDDFKVNFSSNKKIDNLDAFAYYRGFIENDKSSSVSISINQNEISGFIISDKFNLSLGKLNDIDLSHIIYDEQQVQDTLIFDCETEDDGMGYKANDLEFSNDDDLANRCVRLYLEVDNDIFENRGNINETFNFINGLMSQVITLYNNENISLKISEIFIWDTDDPYSSSVSGGLDDFVQARSTFNGNLAHLLSFKSGNAEPSNTFNAGGKANGIDGLCVSGDTEKSPHSHTTLFPSFESFPNFSRQVKVVTHELGHTLGSRHTHACVWNGNNTAIDGCAGGTEGTCSIPSNPIGGGTIMSYCDRQEVGIDFSLGFGSQPGNVIRNRVANMTCQSNCEKWKSIDIIWDEDLYTAHFPSTNIGYAAGGKGTVLKTEDGGNTWSKKNNGIPNSAYIYSIFFINTNIGFAVGNRGNSFKTTNGGNSWVSFNLTTSNIRNVFFINSKKGFIVADGELHRTSNGALNWQNINNLLPRGVTGSDLGSSEIYFRDSNNGFILLQGAVLKTVNGGNSWRKINIPALATYDIDFVDANIGFICGIGTGVLKTTNGGNSWNKLSSFPSNTPQTVQFKDANNGYVAGRKGELFVTEDGGNSWTEKTSTTSNDIHKVIYLDKIDRHIAFGKSGTIIIR